MHWNAYKGSPLHWILPSIASLACAKGWKFYASITPKRVGTYEGELKIRVKSVQIILFNSKFVIYMSFWTLNLFPNRQVEQKIPSAFGACRRKKRGKNWIFFGNTNE